MRILKLTTAFIITLAAMYLCIWATKIMSAGHWGYAIAVNFLFMIVFNLVLDFLLKSRYKSGYFASRPFEQDGTIYRWLGVKYFVFLLRLIGWERLLRKDQPITNDLDALRSYRTTTKSSEAAHVLAAICVAAITVWTAWTHSLGHIHWLILFNILLNLYPVMLQRYNRPRVSRLIRLKEAHANTALQSNDDHD
jgi:hypothetical protein